MLSFLRNVDSLLGACQDSVFVWLVIAGRRIFIQWLPFGPIAYDAALDGLPEFTDTMGVVLPYWGSWIPLETSSLSLANVGRGRPRLTHFRLPIVIARPWIPVQWFPFRLATDGHRLSILPEVGASLIVARPGTVVCYGSVLTRGGISPAHRVALRSWQGKLLGLRKFIGSDGGRCVARLVVVLSADGVLDARVSESFESIVVSGAHGLVHLDFS